MPIPTYEDCFLPILEALADGGDRTMKDVTALVAMRFGLSDEECARLIPSGQRTLIANRVGWAK
jgi:restriction system protein